MTRPRQGSQNRQAAGRGACLPSVSPAVWTRTFLSISASVLSLLRDHHSTQLKCLLPSPERMWRSRVFCSGSRTSGLRGSGGEKCLSSCFQLSRRCGFCPVWTDAHLPGQAGIPPTPASGHPRGKHILPALTIMPCPRWVCYTCRVHTPVTECVNACLCRIKQATCKPAN